jgi:hypothetical protein
VSIFNQKTPISKFAIQRIIISHCIVRNPKDNNNKNNKNNKFFNNNKKNKNNKFFNNNKNNKINKINNNPLDYRTIKGLLLDLLE